MCEIIIKRIPTHAVRSYDIAVCDPSWNFSLPHRFNKCHSLMPILATTGIENYSVNIHLLETEVSHKITEDDRLVITERIDSSRKVLKYNPHSNTYTDTVSINLNVGLNVIFWCNQRLTPTAHPSEEERLKYSNITHLRGGLNVQFTPGQNQVWDTYLLAEARNGYSGKSEASPISSNGDYPFFCTDRITVSRYANSPSGLLQQSWLAAIMQRVKGRREFVYYNMRSSLPLNRVPPFAQEVTYHHLVRLGHPTVGEWTVSGPHQDTA
jgi:hypothetical protein